jgi:GNAT superfamily N-acetyltransferase
MKHAMRPRYTFRTFRPNDLPQLVQLFSTMFRRTAAQYPLVNREDQIEEFLRDGSKRGPIYRWVALESADHGEQVVGHISVEDLTAYEFPHRYRPEENSYWKVFQALDMETELSKFIMVQELFVAPTHEKFGIARTLMRTALAHLEDRLKHDTIRRIGFTVVKHPHYDAVEEGLYIVDGAKRISRQFIQVNVDRKVTPVQLHVFEFPRRQPSNDPGHWLARLVSTPRIDPNAQTNGQPGRVDRGDVEALLGGD